MRSAASPSSKPIVADGHSVLRDFRTNSRMLVLVGLAIPVGVVSALMAKLLLWLIAEITNLVFFQRFGTLLPPLENHHQFIGFSSACFIHTTCTCAGLTPAVLRRSARFAQASLFGSAHAAASFPPCAPSTIVS